MKVQNFHQRSLHLQNPWKWLLIEFASYYGVSDAYTKLRFNSKRPFMYYINLGAICINRRFMLHFLDLLSGTFHILWMLLHQLLIVYRWSTTCYHRSMT